VLFLIQKFGTKEFNELVPEDRRLPASRAVVRVDLTKTQKSCGYGVPVMQFVEERETLNKWGDGLTRKVFHWHKLLISDSNSAR
jgi:hypothetical protein